MLSLYLLLGEKNECIFHHWDFQSPGWFINDSLNKYWLKWYLYIFLRIPIIRVEKLDIRAQRPFYLYCGLNFENKYSLLLKLIHVQKCIFIVDKVQEKCCTHCLIQNDTLFFLSIVRELRLHMFAYYSRARCVIK